MKKNNQLSNNSAPTFTYEQLVNKKWIWKLVDKDLIGEDFAALLEIHVSFTQIKQQEKNYWIISSLNAYPQTIEKFSLNITLLKVVYREQYGKLVMELHIEFQPGASPNHRYLDNGYEADLQELEKNKLALALFGIHKGVQPGFVLEHTWKKDNTIELTTSTITRQFIMNNEEDQLTIKQVGTSSEREVQTIKDPGMDCLFGGKADWVVTSNEEEFCKAL